MKTVDVVVGANWGDEGKGLMTDYLMSKHFEEGSENGVVVLCNGGPQRGHTVTTLDGRRHVFHHFGSGVYARSASYLAADYLVNPMVFRDEFMELDDNCNKEYPVTWVNVQCRVVTPFDMITNQLLEQHRGNNRNGSCGHGIFETIVRYHNGSYFHAGDLRGMSDEALRDELLYIRDNYMPERLREHGIYSLPEEWKSIVLSDNLISNFIEDIRFFVQKTMLTEDDSFLQDWDSVIFEMGQGLMLDEAYSGNWDNATPSDTGLKTPAKILQGLDLEHVNLQVYYVTRPYLTRHGAGELPNECHKGELNLSIDDKTNVPNEFQGTLRYGLLDSEQAEKLLERCMIDFIYLRGAYMEYPTLEGNDANLVITHMNEYEPNFEIGELLDYLSIKGFRRIYLSDGETRESVYEYQGGNNY